MTAILLTWWLLTVTETSPTATYSPVMLGPFASQSACQAAGHVLQPFDHRFWSAEIVRDAQHEIAAQQPSPQDWAHAKAGRQSFPLSGQRFAGVDRHGSVQWIAGTKLNYPTKLLTGCLFT